MIWTAIFFVAVASQNGIALEVPNYINCINCNARRDTPAILGKYDSPEKCENALRNFLKSNSSVSSRGICQSSEITGDK